MDSGEGTLEETGKKSPKTVDKLGASVYYGTRNPLAISPRGGMVYAAG